MFAGFFSGMFLEHISFVGKIRSKMREIGGLKIVVVW
jgi:hypothetical protein